MATRGRNTVQNPYQRIKELEQEKIRLTIELEKIKEEYHKIAKERDEMKERVNNTNSSDIEPKEEPIKKNRFNLFD